eukprot:8888979-Pyramimonas_sp.AAC.1
MEFSRLASYCAWAKATRVLLEALDGEQGPPPGAVEVGHLPAVVHVWLQPMAVVCGRPSCRPR